MYGSEAVVPGDLDLLVCGFCCVDFSRLNCHRKTLQELGESGDTFHSTLAYMKLHKPKMVILENVVSAPWSDEKALDMQRTKITNAYFNELARKSRNADNINAKMTENAKRDWQAYYDGISDETLSRGIDWHLKSVGYASSHIFVDAKSFYLPQTRGRGYMLAINMEVFGRTVEHLDRTGIDAELNNLLQQWAGDFTSLGGRASVPVDHMLTAVADDAGPGLNRSHGMDEDNTRKSVEWTRCKALHAKYREVNGFGTNHPLTLWRENGFKQTPDHWIPSKGLTERVLDTLDCAHLRNINRGLDDRYYRYANFSAY